MSARAVAYQGEPGAFGEAALRAHFGEDVEAVASESFRAVFEHVASGRCDAGIVPVENSLGGSVIENWDLLLEHTGVTVTGERRLAVRHCLLAAPGVRLEDVRVARSHPQALAQSMPFLREHGIEPVAAYNTAGAARDVAERDARDEAAIASERAGELHGLAVLAADVQERDDNTTRFFVIERRSSDVGEGSGASIAFTTPNEPGALHAVLGALAELDVNLGRLESRPTRDTPWEYWFFVDLQRADSAAIDPAFLEHLQARLASVAAELRVLGVYDQRH